MRSRLDPDSSHGHDRSGVAIGHEMNGAPPTVVLLHSSASSGRQWEALAGRLRPAFDVHALDLRGHGSAAAWRGERGLTLDDEAALVLPIVDAARAPVHLVGHSYGGALALHLAARRRDRVRSVAVYEPVLFGLLARIEPQGAAAREAFDLAGRVHALVRVGQCRAAAAAFVDYWTGGSSWARLAADRQASLAARMDTVAQHFDALRRERFDLDRLEGLPLLCLSGSRSPAAAQHIAALLRDQLPRARHEVLDGLGHMGPITDADRVNARIEHHLERAQWPAACATENRLQA